MMEAEITKAAVIAMRNTSVRMKARSGDIHCALVMPGLVPGIRALAKSEDVDGRHAPAMTCQTRFSDTETFGPFLMVWYTTQ